MTATSAQASPNRLTAIQSAAVEAELDAILKSAHFARSKRCHDFLEFVVRRVLEGDTESLSERFIGAKIFGRPIDYETATDAIVRVRANDARRRLSEFYLEHPSPSAVKISLTTGSYVPEFHFPAEAREAVGSASGETSEDRSEVHSAQVSAGNAALPKSKWRRMKWPVLIGVPILIVVAVLAGVWIKHWTRMSSHQAIDVFWEPILREKGDILMCAGGQSPAPGFVTAGKETDYPYFSITTVSSVVMLSSLIERGGAIPRFASAATTLLPQFQEHPVILLNAYNNHWTLRFAEPLRFHFTAESGYLNQWGYLNQSIVDTKRPGVVWKRDSTVPYSSADDYALLARFWDSTTNNWVLILAGIGRNGTEAATQFVVSPQYMQMLRNQLGRSFSNRNIEVVLKVSVIDGKTGAPSIMAVNTW
jgi:hypothetical protein